MIDQITVFLPNVPGALAQATAAIGAAEVQILALMVDHASDFCVVRLICNDPARAAEALAEAGYEAHLSRVIAVEVPDVPGGLAGILGTISRADLNVEYTYTTSIHGRAVDIVRVSSDPVDVKLSQIKLPLLTQEDLT